MSIELILKNFFPFITGSIGHLNAANALAYGWGYNPRELMRILDPDTGDVFTSPLNNHGWRDKDRTYDNKSNSFRIVVIGDSITYGILVPDEKVYTRILEDELKSEGYNVEVINIAYGGWDTEQELEALKREGLLYKPNLIISQFCTNDLAGFDCLSDEQKKDILLQKPFYYKLDENNNLVKVKNNLFFKKYCMLYYVKTIMLNSEILKRCYYLLSIQKFKKKGIDVRNQKISYGIDGTAISRLRHVFHIDWDEKVIEALKRRNNTKISKDDLAQIISASGKIRDREKALRLFEIRFFSALWTEGHFRPGKADPNSCEWRLYFALIKEMNRLALENAADFAIISDNEPGHYEWSVYWGRVEDSPESRESYLSPTEVIRDFTQSEKISFIANKHKFVRARNDSHPNAAGNLAMANDIYDFLKENYVTKLQPYKIK
jgi:lysophospholipase L1-like esterase